MATFFPESRRAGKSKGGWLAACFDVGDRASHQYCILAVRALYTNSVGILPGQRAHERIACSDLDFYRLLVTDEGLDVADAGQAGVECVGSHEFDQSFKG